MWHTHTHTVPIIINIIIAAVDDDDTSVSRTRALVPRVAESFRRKRVGRFGECMR